MPTELSLRLGRLLVVALALPACSSDAGSPDAPGGRATGGGGAPTAGAPNGGGGTSAGGGAMGGAGASAGSSGEATGGGGGPSPCTPATALVCDPTVAFPPTIKETGIYTALPNTTPHHAQALSFEPKPALWSDGLAKERFVILPSGQSVDNTDPKKWQFPVGTVFVKSFYDDGGPNKARRPIETRFIRRGQDPIDPFSQWEFAVYRWNAEGSDATLISFDDPMQTTPTQVVIDRMEAGKPLELNDGMPFTHDIPSKQQCQACHDANAKVTDADIIGFDELRLNWKAAGATKTQLETLVEAKVIKTLPAAPSTIIEADPVLARVKAWALGNCVHCHNGAEGMLDLRPEMFVQTTVNVASEGAGIMPPDATWKRVVPKKPELSVLFVQARRAPLPTGPSVQMRAMPPLGVAVADMTRPNALTDPPAYVGQLPPSTMASQVPDDPLADLATWINGLQ